MQPIEPLLGQACAVHAPCPFHQVVSFVHQQRQPPVVGLGEAMQQGAVIEVVIDVADQHIAPARQFLAQIVGADLVLQRQLTQALAVQPATFDRGLTCLGSRS